MLNSKFEIIIYHCLASNVENPLASGGQCALSSRWSIIIIKCGGFVNHSRQTRPISALKCANFIPSWIQRRHHQHTHTHQPATRTNENKAIERWGERKMCDARARKKSIEIFEWTTSKDVVVSDGAHPPSHTHTAYATIAHDAQSSIHRYIYTNI